MRIAIQVIEKSVCILMPCKANLFEGLPEQVLSTFNQDGRDSVVRHTPSQSHTP